MGVEVELVRRRTLVCVDVDVVIDVDGRAEPVVGLVEVLVLVDLRHAAHSCELEC